MRCTPLFPWIVCLLAACGGESGDSSIEPGDDLTGDYRGCMNESCTELTPAGFRFHQDGKFEPLQGKVPEDWPSECSEFSSSRAEDCSFNDWILCPEQRGFFEGARWQWTDAGELQLSDIPGVPNLTLERKGALIEVPLHEQEPGLFFQFPSSYPDAQWMKRVSRSTDGCHNE